MPRQCLHGDGTGGYQGPRCGGNQFRHDLQPVFQGRRQAATSLPWGPSPLSRQNYYMRCQRRRGPERNSAFCTTLKPSEPTMPSVRLADQDPSEAGTLEHPHSLCLRKSFVPIQQNSHNAVPGSLDLPGRCCHICRQRHCRKHLQGGYLTG